IQMAVAASGTIYIVWEDDDSGNSEILIANSTNGGNSFGSAINLSNSAGASADPQIVISGNNVFVVWTDFIGGNTEIRFIRSTDVGSFGSPINISNTPTESLSPQIAVSNSGNIYVAWQETLAGGNDEVFFARSTDGGTSFSSPSLNLSNTLGDSGTTNLGVPQIATFGDTVYVVWADENTVNGMADIILAKSINDGSSFDSSTNISNTADRSSVSPQIAVSNSGNIYVAWNEFITSEDDFPARSDVHLAASTDSGDHFSNVNVSNNADGFSAHPRLALYGDDVIYVAWDDSYLGIQEILAAKSNNAGGIFSSPVNISNSPLDTSVQPRLAVSTAGSLYVVWYDDTANADVFFNGEIDFTFPSINIDSVNSSRPAWGDEVSIHGSTTGTADGDSVTVVWGDGDLTEHISISVGGSWGPVEHPYGSASVGSIVITSTLVDSTGLIKATSNAWPIDIQKRATELKLNNIASVRQGSDVLATGLITDASTGEGIGGLTITFDGTGAEGILPDVASDASGLFSSSGTSEDVPATGRQVQAHFAGNNAYNASDSVIKAYDTASTSATEFAVESGTNVHVNLEGFDSSIDFEHVTEGGKIFVSSCSDSANSRFVPVEGMCLVISPSIELAENSNAFVHMSFAGKSLPNGHENDVIDLFHVDSLSGIVDITLSRDLNGEIVSGKTMSFSEFIGVVALHSDAPMNAITKQIFVGDGNAISLRDVNNMNNATASLLLDRSSYNPTQQVAVTLQYPDENRNLDKIEVVNVAATSNSDPAGINIALTETGPSTGNFQGGFGLTSGTT